MESNKVKPWEPEAHLVNEVYRGLGVMLNLDLGDGGVGLGTG